MSFLATLQQGWETYSDRGKGIKKPHTQKLVAGIKYNGNIPRLRDVSRPKGVSVGPHHQDSKKEESVKSLCQCKCPVLHHLPIVAVDTFEVAFKQPWVPLTLRLSKKARKEEQSFFREQHM